jgi:hypothetical protein
MKRLMSGAFFVGVPALMFAQVQSTAAVTTDLTFFIYAIAFKVLVVAAGITFIVLGYRLYKNGIVGPDAKGATLKASIAKSEILLKNTGPGTFFAIFGAVLIGLLVFSSSPELSLKSSETNGEISKELYLRSMQIGKMASVFNDYDRKAIKAEDAIEDLRHIYNGQ